MASLTFSPTTLHTVLSSLNLLQYEDALIKAGYDYLNCFDTENNTIEELSQELTNDVIMKKPHARKLTRYLFSQQHQSLNMSAPTAQDVDDGALPIADAIPIPKVLNNNPTSFDPTVVPIPVPIPFAVPVPIPVPVPAITPMSDEIYTKEVTFIENVNWVGYEEGINLFSAKNLSINKPGCIGFFLSNGSESEGQYHWLYSGDQTYVTPKYDGSMTTTNKSLRPVTRLWSCLRENLNASSGETKTNSVSSFFYPVFLSYLSLFFLFYLYN